MRWGLTRLGAIFVVAGIILPPLLCVADGRPEGTKATSETAQEVVARQRVEIHLFGGDMSPGAPLAAWYRQIGITDVWLYTVKGAFPQDQAVSDQQDVDQLETLGTLGSYRSNHVRYWWFERPVPDYLYYLNAQDAGAGQDVIWGSTAFADALWAGICANIGRIYGKVHDAGFSGIVYDNEAYYSYGDPAKPWLWEGHAGQLGPLGGYYGRGRQVGSAILSVWPDAKVMMVYSFGYPGEYWWYKGFQDAGVDLHLAIEHTYGAGPAKPGDQWYQHWWRPGSLTGIVAQKRSVFGFIPDNRHIVSGLFPIDFGTGLPNYDIRYLREQLQQAGTLSGEGPFSVWLWPQGEFTPERWNQIRFPPGVSSSDYLNLLKSSSLDE